MSGGEELVQAEFVGDDLSPPELATIANREHELVSEAAESMVEHAIRCGEALEAVKTKVGHGNWLDWLGPNFRASTWTADLYMRLYANRGRIHNMQLERLGLKAIDKRLSRIKREEDAGGEGEEGPLKTDDIDLRPGDLRTELDDLKGSVDAVITDPPYPAEFVDEFAALGEVASRILKPGGLLVAMVGQTHLPAYIERLGKHLPYRWCGAYLTDGPATRIHGRKVGTKWKPLLIYGGKDFITQDVFQSDAEDKAHHEWGQSESGMADIVNRLTEPGQLVVDPFLGAGTTAVVCKELGRRFVGCDIDAAAINAARARL